MTQQAAKTQGDAIAPVSWRRRLRTPLRGATPCVANAAAESPNAVAGQNAAGKSTLFKTISGRPSPSAVALPLSTLEPSHPLIHEASYVSRGDNV
jgi:hypothetical protein